jgi:hypothetical protein
MEALMDNLNSLSLNTNIVDLLGSVVGEEALNKQRKKLMPASRHK